MTRLRRAYAAQTRSLNKKCPSDKSVPSEEPGPDDQSPEGLCCPDKKSE